MSKYNTPTYIAPSCDGKWDNDVIACESVCGILPETKQHIIGRQDTDVYPWHVLIYKRTEDTFVYYCVGTIINPDTIVTGKNRFFWVFLTVISASYQIQIVRRALQVKFHDLWHEFYCRSVTN